MKMRDNDKELTRDVCRNWREAALALGHWTEAVQRDVRDSWFDLAAGISSPKKLREAAQRAEGFMADIPAWLTEEWLRLASEHQKLVGSGWAIGAQILQAGSVADMQSSVLAWDSLGHGLIRDQVVTAFRVSTRLASPWLDAWLRPSDKPDHRGSEPES
jgi:hypothetical protein